MRKIKKIKAKTNSTRDTKPRDMQEVVWTKL